MLPIIVVFTLILYLVLIMYMYHSLYGVDKKQAILIIIIGIAAMYLITTIIYTIMYNGIQKEFGQLQEEVKSAKWLIINIFTSVNGLILLPYLCKNISKYKQNLIDEKIFKKRILIRLIILIIFIIFEVSYIKDTTSAIIVKQINTR